MPADRIPKQVLYGELSEGKRSVGGQKKRFKDCLKPSLQEFDINHVNWESLAQDRFLWRTKVRQGLVTAECKCRLVAEGKRAARKDRVLLNGDPMRFVDKIQLLNTDLTIVVECIIAMLGNHSDGLWRDKLAPVDRYTYGSNGGVSNGIKDTNKDMDFQLRLPRMNLQNKTLKIASVTRIPFQNITRLSNGEYVEGGFTFEIINQLSSFFNFSYKIVMPEDNAFGKLRDENGTKKWNGMIKQLLDKEADLAAAMFTITEDRREVVEFTKNIYLDGIDILMQYPKESDNTSALLSPFSINVWAMIIASFFAMGPVIYAIQVLQRKLVKLDETTDRKNRFTLVECVWFVYAGLVKQGSELSPIYDSTRILFATWWIFTLIVTAFYTANLTAFLTLPHYKTIKSLDTLLQHSETTWLVKYGGALDAAIEEGHGKIFQKLRSSFRMGQGKHLRSDYEARSLIEKGGYVYLHETLSLKYLLLESYQRSNGKCVLALANQNFFEKPFGFAYPKGSPYAFAFNEL
ncbi:glutamate receptor ionotropic, delta-2-like [Limulus polyphemus]|uniref:Glutamate receptor ionotropic, delta-2-like n=1 Tax=Limulus polyphemus TaxID=6850 RepID=A0ABM1C5M8_LIMPO|nr:glutamate receptor ionotropic, delta-2-like [Limulus polyphemus]